MAQSITDSLVIEDKIHINYDSDKYDIKPIDRERINVLALKYFDPAYLFRLDAHTDSDGSDEYNIALSRKRCDGIKEILLNKKIASERIDYFSHGETQLLVEENNADQKSINRRATIKVFKKTEFITFGGNLSPESSLEKITGKIYIEYENHKSSISTDSTGTYILQLPTNKNVELNILAKDYFPLKKEIKLSRNSRTDKLKFDLTKYSVNNSVRTTIQFKGNKSIVLKKSLPELSYLGLSLKTNPDVCVELEGHVNLPNQKSVPRDHHDFGLSIARSVIIFNYLVEHGISKDRLLAKGYGNSQMIYPLAILEKEQSINRRVEVKVISCEKAAATKNDSVPDLSIYNTEDPMSKYFSYKSLDADLLDFPNPVQQEIKDQIEYMTHHKQNLNNHTYLQLLAMSRSRVRN